MLLLPLVLCFFCFASTFFILITLLYSVIWANTGPFGNRSNLQFLAAPAVRLNLPQPASSDRRVGISCLPSLEGHYPRLSSSSTSSSSAARRPPSRLESNSALIGEAGGGGSQHALRHLRRSTLASGCPSHPGRRLHTPSELPLP